MLVINIARSRRNSVGSVQAEFETPEAKTHTPGVERIPAENARATMPLPITTEEVKLVRLEAFNRMIN